MPERNLNDYKDNEDEESNQIATQKMKQHSPRILEADKYGLSKQPIKNILSTSN